MDIDNKKYDVVIVGSGIIGLSVAHHLGRTGVNSVLLIGDSNALDDRSCDQILLGGYPDNITRLAHTFGKQAASQIWRYSQKGVRYLKEFMEQSDPGAFRPARTLRLARDPMEVAELTEAVRLLNELGFDGKLISASELPNCLNTGLSNQKTLYGQDEGLTSGVVTAHSYRQLLQGTLNCTRLESSPSKIVDDGGRLEIFYNTQRVNAELVVIASHLEALKLLPDLKDILIPYSDQWMLGQAASALQMDSPIVFSGNYGYVWGTIGTSQVVVGGGRYLKKDLGYGDAKCLGQEFISQHLTSKYNDIANGAYNWDIKNAIGFSGCRPCDDLPLVGPMFGSERILLGVGLLGYDASFGFQVGKSLSSLILTGNCNELPPQFLPRRLRSF